MSFFFEYLLICSSDEDGKEIGPAVVTTDYSTVTIFLSGHSITSTIPVSTATVLPKDLDSAASSSSSITSQTDKANDVSTAVTGQ